MTQAAPLVAHPTTGKPGLFVPDALVIALTPSWHPAPPRARWASRTEVRGGSVIAAVPWPGAGTIRCVPDEFPCSDVWNAHLQANEFDPTRAYECLLLSEGVGVFYL